MLSAYSAQLNAAVAVGVGLAAVVGTLMLLKGWSLRRVLGWSLLPAVVLSAATLRDEQLQQVVGLAWDTGAVTTGPVTVPIVLALGAGLAQSRADAAAASGDGFRLPASTSATANGFGTVPPSRRTPDLHLQTLCDSTQPQPPTGQLAAPWATCAGSTYLPPSDDCFQLAHYSLAHLLTHPPTHLVTTNLWRTTDALLTAHQA